MLLVFRQHRLASSATGGASATLHVLFERSEFTGECAELPTESRRLCTAARRCRGLGAQPIKRQAHIGFAQQNCLHLKVLDF